jgi:hypothetical protein
MRFLVIVSTGTAGSSARLAEITGIWSGQGHQDAVHRLDGPVEYSVLLDAILDAQPDAVLLSGLDGDDARVRSVADVVWKFDNTCRVLLDGPPTTVEGVVAVDGQPSDVAAAVVSRPHAADPFSPPPASASLPGPWSGTAALLVSRGWARGADRCLTAAAAAEIRAAMAACDRDGMTVTDRDGYRHAVAVVRYAPSLLGLLDDPRLGGLVRTAIGLADIWLGALEGIAAGSSLGWRRELAVPLLAAGSSEFRPGLSVLVALDEDGGLLRAHAGSHRWPALLRRDPPSTDRVPLACGELALVEGGCRFRLDVGRFLHLRFIRAWMKPDILLAGPLRDQAARLGGQARQWCGLDIGLPTSVEEFLGVEEAALAGGLATRKGSGI